MIERIVEHWLTRTSERSFETPFVQLLTAEGFKVLHAPAHHPQEHGKDLIAISPTGELCAYQLKGPNLDLKEFTQHAQGQLLALVATAISYPGVEPPRPPDRAFLVTSGSLTPPVRGRLEALNVGNAARKVGKLECIEKEQLVARFTRAHGKYLPSEPREFNHLFELLLNDGKGFLDVSALTNLLNKTIGEAREDTELERSRAIASGVLFTSYAVAPWEREENHLAVAQGWLVLCAAILHYATATQLDERFWVETFDLAFAAAETALLALIDEIGNKEDFLVPDLAESLVYPTRSLLICGYISASYLANRNRNFEHTEVLKRVLKRELPFIRITGEGGCPALFLIATALSEMSEKLAAGNLVAAWATTIARVNAPDSDDAVPDPYHSHEECLRRSIGAEVNDPEERFDGNTYSLHVAIDWLVRRNARPFLTQLWPDITRVTFCEFEVSAPEFTIWPGDSAGVLKMWHGGRPQSWAQLVVDAAKEQDKLPPGLLARKQFLPFVGLLFPQRFTRGLASAIDRP
jgi:hypothetical protein